MLCPRCESEELADDLALNALSRTTRGEHDIPVYVCSPCGNAEGINEYMNGTTEAQADWPVASVWPDGQPAVGW